MNRAALAAYLDADRRRRLSRADLSGQYGYAASQHLATNANGFVLDVVNDVVLVKRSGFPEFLGSMEQALAAGILVYPSPSTKYVRNSAGILVPGTSLRCHYDVDGTPLGILPEPQRTNLATYSEQFDNAAWTKRPNTGVQSNATVAPDGTTTADRIYDSAGTPTGVTYARRTNITLADNTIYVLSVYVKRGQRQNVSLTSCAKSSVADYVRVTFDFDAVTLTETIGGAAADTASGFEYAGNGWYRVWVRINSGTGAVVLPCEIASPYTVDGSGTYDFFVWGAQLEVGLFPTSYIKTEGITVTRSGDDLYVDLAKVPFDASAYTVIAHAQPNPDSVSNGHAVYTIHDTTTNERVIVRSGTAGADAVQAVVVRGGVTQAAMTEAGANAAAFKTAFAATTNDFEFVVDGASIGTDTSGSMPVDPTRIQIGRNVTDTGHYAAPIGFIALIPERLSQADMIARTS